jgi:hypothetical protein
MWWEEGEQTAFQNWPMGLTTIETSMGESKTILGFTGTGLNHLARQSYCGGGGDDDDDAFACPIFRSTELVVEYIRNCVREMFTWPEK